ncbi:alpha/beta hydrolase [Actinospica sp. MGRD01-02]|uniref:Alpha/beta hydrolase n=1 Tax=Actinospica acidithermotolerans TaxID=2828514 RepID=A0A941E775_9ACTN|nr:alpha/beta hydrolase [Actinospica acidithermotolerans]MBR7827615.1 alpha/beta hydrolase [Actinospica acidithermotolerans]
MELMVQTGGGEVWVRDSGGDGVPVVLLHPGWGDSGIWDEIARELEAQQVRVVRYDSLGYGESSAPTQRYTALEELRAVLDRLDVRRAVLAGHSGGGGTALSMAIAEPDRVAELILLAPGASGYPWPRDDPFMSDISAAVQARDVEGAVEIGLRTWARAGSGEAVETQIRSAVAGMERQARYLDEDPPVFDRLGEIRTPATMFVGDLEYPMVADCCRAIADRLPSCRVLTLPGSDHMVPLRAPGAVAELVLMAVTAAETPA